MLRRMTCILGLALSAAAGANVFGDGDPVNGIEDSRQALHAPAAGGSALDAWRRSAGTIHCEGGRRGTAMVLDVSHLGEDRSGWFLATAAHVFSDLASGRPFRDCEFHFLALGELPGHRVPIDPAWIHSGAFEVIDDWATPEFGQDDWAFVYLPDAALPPGRVAGIRPMAWPAGTRDDDVEYRLVGYDRSRSGLVISGGCSVRDSRADDLGGGAWPGQLLDDCDSGDGASGGGLIAQHANGQYLVGIRTGAHWSASIYPRANFPHGPPDGSPWDRQGNTNFARAIDEELLAALEALVARAADQE